jgi:hypothetical protein
LVAFEAVCLLFFIDSACALAPGSTGSIAPCNRFLLGGIALTRLTGSVSRHDFSRAVIATK